MRRKGFTLVELLAVIAILAILTIIALPNVLELFKNAKKNAFFNEVQSIYESAKNKFFLNQFNDNSNHTYTNTSGNNKLDIENGTGEFKYCVNMDSNGYITSINISDGEYKYEINSKTDKADISKVELVGDDYEFSCNSESTPEYIYYVGTENKSIGDTLSVNNTNTFDNYSAAVNTFGYPIFSAHNVNDSNAITDSYVGFVKNGTAYYLKGADSGASYHSNKVKLIDLFGVENCTGDTNILQANNINYKKFWGMIGIPSVKAAATKCITCEDTEFTANACLNGSVRVTNLYVCQISSNKSNCGEPK